MLPIQIVPQRGEFGCAKAVIKTVMKTKFGLEVDFKDPFLYFKSLGTLNFLSMANDALRQNTLSGRFIKKTNVKFEEIEKWLSEETLMVILFISRENYPHFVVLADINEDVVTVANTHGATFDEFLVSEFIERFYLNPRYVDHIQWMRGKYSPIMDRIVRWGIRIGKALSCVKPGTVYILDT